MPNHIGAFLKASKCFATLGINITRVSYDKSVDSHMLFLDVEDPQRITEFMKQAEQLCKVKIIDYNSSGRTYDNSIFYNAFVRGLAQMLALTEEEKQSLLVSSNLAMQTLDEQGLSPYRTFDSISKFAELLAKSKNEKFVPRITTHQISKKTQIILIEPACDSNTAVIISDGELLFVDSGYACYKDEMLQVLNTVIPEFNKLPKRLLLTHADVDHCGMMDVFDEIIVSHNSARSLINESKGKNGFREEKPIHKPYIDICKTLTAYKTVDPKKLKTPWMNAENLKEPLTQIGFFDFADLHFEVYEGKGGHLPGEVVLIDYKNHIAFTGDVYINVHGLTAEQAEYNQYAPILMTSVDTDPKLCGEERTAVLQRLGIGNWKIFGAHGAPKEYSVK